MRFSVQTACSPCGFLWLLFVWIFVCYAEEKYVPYTYSSLQTELHNLHKEAYTPEQLEKSITRAEDIRIRAGTLISAAWVMYKRGIPRLDAMAGVPTITTEEMRDEALALLHEEVNVEIEILKNRAGSEL
eukprot:TRINITY_DN79513_c0_g1_i1.p1 TRINITY_DN79513_c0_g1~~TRINITY_DN79513_c0_g1_i1.p1  ORF type:complete len:130 (-),score=5.22 TRINITY_DN79513_c0_g1_i1:183-572(-)